MKVLFLTLITMTLGFSCGDEEEDKEDTYTTCTIEISDGNGFCQEAKNASGAEQACTQLGGTYGTGQCDVAAGTQGCRQTNSNGVEVTTWYTGPLYEDGIDSVCADEGETIVTKE